MFRLRSSRFKKGIVPLLVGTMARVALPVGIGVAIDTAVKAAPAGAATAPGGNFSCRASVARLEQASGAVILEPFIANGPDNPCKPAHAGILAPTALATLGTVTAVSADTAGFDFNRTVGQPAGTPPNPSPCKNLNAPAAAPPSAPCADASAVVADVNLFGVGPGIRAQVLTSEAHGRCDAAGPHLSGDSQVVQLTIGTTTVAIPPGKNTEVFNQGGISVRLRQEISTPNRITERAIDIRTPIVNVIVAESTVDTSNGDPCTRPVTCGDLEARAGTGPDGDPDDQFVAPVPAPPNGCECPGANGEPPLVVDSDPAPCGTAGECPTGTHSNPLFPPTNPPCCPDHSEDGDDEVTTPPGACVCEEADDTEAPESTEASSDQDFPEVPCCPADGDSDDGQLTTEENESCECPPATPDGDDATACCPSDDAPDSTEASDDSDDACPADECPPATTSSSEASDDDGDDDSCPATACAPDSDDTPDEAEAKAEDMADGECDGDGLDAIVSVHLLPLGYRLI